MQSTTPDPRSLLPIVREMLRLCGTLPIAVAVDTLKQRVGALPHGVACDAVRYAVNCRAIKTTRTRAGEWSVTR